MGGQLQKVDEGCQIRLSESKAHTMITATGENSRVALGQEFTWPIAKALDASEIDVVRKNTLH